jgi:hypothetical protein
MLKFGNIKYLSKFVGKNLNSTYYNYSLFYKKHSSRFSQLENFEEYILVFDSKTIDEKSIELAKSIKITDACDKR